MAATAVLFLSLAGFAAAEPPWCFGYIPSSGSANPGPSAGSVALSVWAIPGGCIPTFGWTASGNGSWITIAPTSGFGSSPLAVSWTANTSAAPRTNTGTIAGSTFTVNQAAAQPCTGFTLSDHWTNPPSAPGSLDVTVSGSPEPCFGTWTASGNGSWITVSPASGDNLAHTTISWSQNTSPEARHDFATIEDMKFVVGQAGYPPFAFGPNEVWSGTHHGSRGTFFADVTGDLKLDAIAVNDAGIDVRRSAGSGFGPLEAWSNIGFYGSRGTEFADVTGDGRADSIVVNDFGVTVRRSTGSGFAPNEAWTDGPYYGTLGTYFADVTGDGLADAIVVNDGLVVVRPSTGSRFAANEVWTTGGLGATHGIHFADVTGDGRADAIALTDSGVRVGPSIGIAFAPAEAWTHDAYYGARGTRFADVDGDSRYDAIFVNDGSVSGRPSSIGGTLGPLESWTNEPYYGTRGTEFADVTGDGRADAIVINDFGITVRRSTQQ